MACWQIADEEVTKEKIRACKTHGIKTCAGGGPLEVAASCGKIPEYLDLCAYIGPNTPESAFEKATPTNRAGFARGGWAAIAPEPRKSNEARVDHRLSENKPPYGDSMIMQRIRIP